MRRALSCIVLVLIASIAQAAGDDATPLTLAEATAEGVKFESLTTVRPRLAVTLINPSKDPLEEVKVWGPRSVAVDSKGKRLPGDALTFDKLAPFERKVIHLELHRPALGEHTVMLWLSSKGKDAKSIALKFSRIALPGTSLAIDVITGQRVDIPLFSWSGSTELTVPVRETAGKPARDIRLSLRMVMKVDDKTSFTAPAPHLRFNGGQPLELGAEEARNVAVMIDGIDRAGRYDATIVLQTGRAGPVASEPIPLFVRQSWGVAAAWILFGILVSLLVKLLTKVIRPRLAVQRRIADLADALRAMGRQTSDAAAQQLIVHLEHSLERRYGTLSLGGRILSAADFDLYEAKLPLLRAWIDNQAQLAVLALPGASAEVAQRGLVAAANVLQDENATVDAVRAQLTALAGLRNSVNDALAVEIHRQVDALKAAITQSGAAELQPLLGRIKPIDEHLIARRMQQALADARALQGDYVRTFIEVFRRQLATRPHSFPKEQWPQLVADVTVPLDSAASQGDAALALEQLRQAIQRFVSEAAEHLVRSDRCGTAEVAG